jgi:hypothetical protein
MKPHEERKGPPQGVTVGQKGGGSELTCGGRQGLGENEPPRRKVERAVRLAGRFSSGKRDVSAAHDRFLSEAFDR